MKGKTHNIDEVYQSLGLEISEQRTETESKEYNACRFQVDGHQIIYRNAKITPKKLGQFVTFWKRNVKGITEPFHENDSFDFYIVNIQKEDKMGQFIFPKRILIEKGIVSTKVTVGKRGFRVYPVWDPANSKQALKTQKWQLEFFYEINDSLNLELVKKLFKLD